VFVELLWTIERLRHRTPAPSLGTPSPRGAETAYKDTWALGALKPGRSKTFNWDVTAVDVEDGRVGGRRLGCAAV